MKKSSKWLGILLTAALTMSLAACGGQKPPVSGAESSPGESSSATSQTAFSESSVPTGEESSDVPTAQQGTTGSKGETAPKTTKTATKTQGNGGDNVWGQRPTGNTSNIPTVTDMKGATIVIGTKWIEDFGNCEPGKSALNDKWIAWRANFEKKFNCKLKNEYVSPFSLFASISSKLLSGDKVADIISMQLYDVEMFRHAGLLQPLQASKTLNLEHPLVIQDMINNFTFNGKSYLYMATDMVPETFGLYVNRDLIKSLKVDDPYELVRQKKWTWEAFDKICQAAYKDLNNNNKIDASDRFGAAFGDGMAMGSLRVSGIKTITYDSGKFSYTYNNAKTLKYINAIKDTVNAGNRVLPGEFLEQGLNKFVKGELVFAQQASDYKRDPENILWDADFDMGFLPIPTHEAGMAYSNSCSTWLAGWSIPKNTDQLDYIGCFLNAVAEMNYSNVELGRADQKRWFGNDKETYDLFRTYCNNFTVDLYCWQSQFKDYVQGEFVNMLFDKNVTAAKYLESIDTPMKNAVKDYYSKDPDLME